MPLNKEKILSNLPRATRQALGEIHCHEQLASTNLWLLEQARQQSVHNHICIADVQTAGIGRNGKHWQASKAKNILLSIAHEFDLPLANLPGLSLVTAVAVVNVIERLGVENLSVKWPNDVYINDAKLAGILIQTQAAGGGYCVVIGIGLNIELDHQDKSQISQPVAELVAFGISVTQREQITAGLIDGILNAISDFKQFGMAHFYPRWRQLDYLTNRSIILSNQQQAVSGVYKGINLDGAALIELQNNQIAEYYVGEISVSLT